MKPYKIAIAILITCLVWSFSLQSGEDSSQLSGGLSTWALSIINTVFPSWNLSIDLLHTIIRKSAHLFSYACSGFTWAWALKGIQVRWEYYLALGLGISITGELLQFLSPERGPSLVDAFGFNFIGFLFGWMFVQRYVGVRSQKRAE